MRLSDMTPERREKKRASAHEYEQWRKVYRLYLKLCDQRGVPKRT